MKHISFRHLNLIVSIALLTISVSCSKDDGGKGGDNLKKTVLNMPWIDSEPLTGSTGNVDFWKFSAPYTEDGKFNVCAVQNGNVADLGKQAYKRTDNNGTAATIDIDLKGKINEDTAYDLYLISGNYSIFSGNIWSTVPLERSDKPTFFYSRKNVSGPFSADAQICGVIESVYIINKSGKSIKFVQKPFIADEKWYYTKADINLLDGSVRNAKTESEPTANTYEVYAHAEGQSFRISSSYIPNGKKIQNARLQAEIDGKIYTTENTISSDLDLQMGHAYGMVVIWDGEKLRFDGSGVMPDVHIYSNEDNYDTSVEEIRGDGTVVLSGKETDIPEKGEIIYSDVTTVAPYGFLYKVESVEKEGDKTLIHTSPAGLGELLPDQNFKAPMLLYDDQPAPGVKRRVKMKEDKAINLFNKKFVKDFKSGDFKWGDLTFEIGSKFIGDFDLETHGWTVERLAIEAGISLYLKLILQLALERKWEIPCGELDNLPMIYVPTPVGFSIPIKVVAGIKFGIDPKELDKSPFAGEKNASAKAYFKWKILDKDFYFKGKCGYTRIPDENGNNCFAGFESNIPTTSDEFKKMLKEMFFNALDVELGFKGDALTLMWQALA